MDVIVGSTCNGYTSNNCANKCHAIKYVEACKRKKGKIKCINSADDSKTCEIRITSKITLR
ncbi:hypothetical protein HZS_3127 [Henneguya salminicola]|nr:hypothetical protein HZS_3127 [Henneguya salminicola]